MGGFAYFENSWCCCNCGDTGQTLFIDCCPMCGHVRCSDCSVEAIPSRNARPPSRDFEEWVFVGRLGNEIAPPLGSQTPENSISSKTVSEDYAFQSTLDRIFASYNDWKQQIAEQQDPSSSTEGNKKRSNAYTGQQALPSSHGKRTIDEIDLGRPSDEATLVLSRKKTKYTRSLKLLACPFWKRNYSRHRECCKYKLSKIGHVKQHLKRRHQPQQRPLIQCGRCGQTFHQMAHLDQHLQEDQPCVSGAFEVQELSEHQSTELSRLSDRRLTIEDQWYRMWDIIHPGIARPESPYLEQGLSEELLAYHEFIMNHGLDFLHEEDRIRFPREYDHRRRFLGAGLQRILDSYIRTLAGNTITDQDHSSSTVTSEYSTSLEHQPQPQEDNGILSTLFSIPSEVMEWERDWYLDDEEVHGESWEDEEPERNFQDPW